MAAFRAQAGRRFEGLYGRNLQERARPSYRDALAQEQESSGIGAGRWRPDQETAISQTEEIARYKRVMPEMAPEPKRRRIGDVVTESENRRFRPDLERLSRDPSSALGDEALQADRTSGSLQRDPLIQPERSGPDLRGGPVKRRISELVPHGAHGQEVHGRADLERSSLRKGMETLERACRARDFHAFSIAVVDYTKQLKMPILATFLERAAALFESDFIPRWEDNVRDNQSWGYALTCNAVSREAGGRAGIDACKAMAAHVSQLDDALMRKVELRALSLFAVSFGRHPQSTTCRNATIRIAKFFCEENLVLQHLNDLSLSSLANGFSKWPERTECRDGMIAIATELVRRAKNRTLSDVNQQQLPSLVNTLCKWPKEAICRKATAAIADEVFGRAQLSDYNSRALTNLVNGFSKWPEEARCERAALSIASEVTRRQLGDFDPQGLANLVNGFSKWSDRRLARRAGVAIAAEVFGRELSDFAPQNLALLVNGFSKWPRKEDCREATVAIAREIQRRKLRDFTPQALVNLVNGFSKWPEEAHCRAGTAALAGELLRTRLRGITRPSLALLVNGFSKWPHDSRCHAGALAIAPEILELARGPDGLSGFTELSLANLVNGFSKWPQEMACRKAVAAVAEEITGFPDRLSHCSQQDLANLVNGFSKWPKELACEEATVGVADEILDRAGRHGRLSGFAETSLANLVNAFSKWPDRTSTLQASIAVADEILNRPDRVLSFTRRESSSLVNGFSKWPREESCRQATAAIARDLLDRHRLSDFNSLELTNLTNGFSKWRSDEDCSEAAVAIAREMLRRRLSDFTPQQQADLMNSFIKWRGEAACSQAIVHLARDLGRGGQRFAAFTTPDLSRIANALGLSFIRAEEAGDIADASLLKDRLQQLVHYLNYANDRLEQADLLSITNIFKSLGKARLFDDLALLAPTGLSRLEELAHAPGFAAENNLESMGNICIALLPLARSPEKSMLWHRRQALNLLNDLQPGLEQKVRAYLQASNTERRSRASLSSRRPALSIFQVLKAREVLASLYQRPYVEGTKSDLATRRQQLERETKKILAETRNLIESDLSNMSWNLIAQIEGDDAIDALDSFMTLDEGTIRNQHPPSVFDMHQVLRTMDHEPRPPEGEAGLMQLPVVDLQGRRLATQPEQRYSIFHRLTSGAIPMVAVQLPGKPSPFMLRRVFCVDDIPYRMDLFGGSKLKAPKPTLSQIASVAPGERGPKPSGGKLLAIPYAETAPGTAFEQLSRAWAPFKEAYYYTQRRGFAAPPSIDDLGPRDYALEGNFKLSLLPDRPAGEEHPFKLIGPEGPIALRPHDGSGFIRASLAERMLAVRRAGRRDGPDLVPAFAEGKKSSLPAAALQYYSRSERVAEEAREKANSWLERKKGEPLSSEELYRIVTAGHIEAPGAVAVPSNDGRVHVPKLKSEGLTGTAGVLIGRSPYDKPNLRPLSPERVKSSADGDATAAFLDKCVAIQYSFNVAEKSGEQLASDDPTFFAKGILIVVPDEMWPANYRDRAMVLSAEDVKSHSAWTSRKERVTAETPIDGVGILQATEVFAPGSLVAVPPDEQKKLDGDFDGDTVIIIGDRPQLYEHVRQFDEAEQARAARSLKPPKSHTPAIEDGRYNFSRASQILAATQDTLESFSTLQRDFLAQPDQARRWFAERAIFGTYEGIHHELRRAIRDLLNQEEVSDEDIQPQLESVMREIDLAEHPVAREINELLAADLEAWAADANGVLPLEAVERDTHADHGVSQAVSDLLPDLAEAYQASAHPRDRVQALLDHYPARIDSQPDGYEPDNLIQSASNLLSLGNKVGTDAYKSDTSAQLFLKKGQQLRRLLQQTPGLRSVPYVKGLAATLNHGRFDVDASLKDLKDNPTLTASVMEAAIKLAADKRILPEASGRQLTAEDSVAAMNPKEAADRAEIERARAAAEEEGITTAVRKVAEILRRADIDVNMPRSDRPLRSTRSMANQLMGTSPKDGDTQLISNAVRHLFEIPDKDFARGFKKAILAFDEQGYTEVSTTNWFRMRDPTFIGVTSVLTTPDGYRFALEFHTAQSYQAKLTNHDIYKKRDKLKLELSGDALEEATKELAQSAREVCRDVAIPEGARELPHWGVELDARASPGFGPRAAERPRLSEKSPMAKEVVSSLGSRPIVLVGLPGAGKSSIGPALARRLGLAFVDSDKKIQRETGMSITEIFDAEDKGKQWFRDREASLIAQCVEKGNVVLATGGGAFENEETRRLILNNAVSIWLDTDRGEIWKRLANDTSRPLLRIDQAGETSGLQSSDKTAMKKERFEEIVRHRTPHYRQANVTIVPPHKRNNNKNAEACVAAVHAYLSGGAGLGAQQAGSVQKLAVASSSEKARDSGGLLMEEMRGLPSSSARAPSRDIHRSPGALAGLPSTSHVLHDDDDHQSSVLPPKTSGARTDALDPTAALHGRGSLALDAQEWLGDEHIAADYALLEEELQRENPDLAAQTRFVPPALTQLLRLAENPNDVRATFMAIVHDQNGNDTANFLLLPVNDGGTDGGGTHWSLLLVDRRAPQSMVAYHYDSGGRGNRAVAEELTARLGARLRIAPMAQQQNGYDCGVFLLDATRALVGRLAQGQWPEQLQLDNLVADRQALGNRLRAYTQLG
ncbi:XopAD/skwp family type III secretion system effector [Bradyrhizobium sp. BRP22]|uniref:XopAD/skwp family type III secretion system effector n=1 Tax=Bradyrhizobium sp. BRP22 TaxID=2793821 RepID=UPI001CD43C76